MTLTEQVEHLRGLAQMERETSLLQLAMLNVLAEVCVAVDQLRGDGPPEEPERGFGTI